MQELGSSGLSGFGEEARCSDGRSTLHGAIGEFVSRMRALVAGFGYGCVCVMRMLMRVERGAVGVAKGLCMRVMMFVSSASPRYSGLPPRPSSWQDRFSWP